MFAVLSGRRSARTAGWAAYSQRRTLDQSIDYCRLARTLSIPFTSVGSPGVHDPDRSSELHSGCITFGGAPILGPMQTGRPVFCGGQIDRLMIQAILPDGCLGELECVRIVRLN